MRVGRPFRLPVPENPTLLRFHLPLIEPDVRICRIRLSDQDHTYAHEELRGRRWRRRSPSVACRLRSA